MRFLVDESTGPVVAGWLREQGHVVFSVYEEAPGLDDDALVTKAFQERMILVTNDKDFGEQVYRLRRDHCGVLLLRLRDERAANKIAVYDVCSPISPIGWKTNSLSLRNREFASRRGLVHENWRRPRGQRLNCAELPQSSLQAQDALTQKLQDSRADPHAPPSRSQGGVSEVIWNIDPIAEDGMISGVPAKPSVLVDIRVIYFDDNLDRRRKLPSGCIDKPFRSNPTTNSSGARQRRADSFN